MNKLILFFAFFYAFGLSAQSAFPQDWIGDYSGVVTTEELGPYLSNQIAVELSIQELIPDSVWTHKLTYIGEFNTRVTQDCIIRIKQKGQKIRYILDYQNGITMELSLMDNCFYGFYSVEMNSYSRTLRLNSDGTLFWDFFGADLNTQKTDSIDDEGEKIEVHSFRVISHETALLIKKK
jgi:hypothetical protein